MFIGLSAVSFKTSIDIKVERNIEIMKRIPFILIFLIFLVGCGVESTEKKEIDTKNIYDAKVFDSNEQKQTEKSNTNFSQIEKNMTAFINAFEEKEANSYLHTEKLLLVNDENKRALIFYLDNGKSAVSYIFHKEKKIDKLYFDSNKIYIKTEKGENLYFENGKIFSIITETEVNQDISDYYFALLNEISKGNLAEYDIALGSISKENKLDEIFFIIQKRNPNHYESEIIFKKSLDTSSVDSLNFVDNWNDIDKTSSGLFDNTLAIYQCRYESISHSQNMEYYIKYDENQKLVKLYSRSVSGDEIPVEFRYSGLIPFLVVDLENPMKEKEFRLEEEYLKGMLESSIYWFGMDEKTQFITAGFIPDDELRYNSCPYSITSKLVINFYISIFDKEKYNLCVKPKYIGLDSLEEPLLKLDCLQGATIGDSLIDIIEKMGYGEIQSAVYPSTVSIENDIEGAKLVYNIDGLCFIFTSYDGKKADGILIKLSEE